MKTKLEYTDIIELQAATAPTKEQLAQAADYRNALLEAVQSEIIAHISTVKFIAVDEEGSYDVNFAEFEKALAMARESDLERFPKTRKLDYEDGYILVKW